MPNSIFWWLGLGADVRFVPEAEVNLWILNVGYGESRRSDFIGQGLLSALSGLS